MTDSKPALKQPERVHLLDTLRGAAILAMLLQHLAFTVAMFELDVPIFGFRFYDVLYSLAMEWVHLPFAVFFVFLSGICCSFSRSNLRRGIICFLLGEGVTLVTFFIGMPDWFGILHLLGLCMILYGLLGRFVQRIQGWWFFALMLALGLVTYEVPQGSLGLPGLTICHLPDWLYQYDFLCVLGFASKSFASLDYFPLIPWAFFFFAGGWLGYHQSQKGWPKWTLQNKLPFLSAVGRHTLIIYLAHQPVFYALCWLLERLFFRS